MRNLSGIIGNVNSSKMPFKQMVRPKSLVVLGMDVDR